MNAYLDVSYVILYNYNFSLLVKVWYLRVSRNKYYNKIKIIYTKLYKKSEKEKLLKGNFTTKKQEMCQISAYVL